MRQNQRIVSQSAVCQVSLPSVKTLPDFTFKYKLAQRIDRIGLDQPGRTDFFLLLALFHNMFDQHPISDWIKHFCVGCRDGLQS